MSHDFSREVAVMAIVNRTPDSFFDMTEAVLGFRRPAYTRHNMN